MNRSKPPGRLRIALFTTGDIVWGLTTWKRTMPVLLKEHDVVGIYLFPERLSRLRGLRIPLWYLRVFGFWSFILLGLFSLKRRLLVLRSSIRSWQQLAQYHGVQLHYATSPNADEVVSWSKENDIDIIIIMARHILKEAIINAARIGVVNKHAAMLPSCRGLFPFFWSKLTGTPTGITLHEVDTGIDTGRILLQVRYPFSESTPSMLRYYIDAFATYPELVSLAIRRLAEGQYVSTLQELTPSYYSLPTRADYKNFHRKGFRIAKFSDLFYEPSDDIAEDYVRASARTTYRH